MILNEVTQRMLESYQALLIEKGAEVRAASAFNRIVIEAASESGIAKNAPDNLLDLTPKEVKRLTEKIAAHMKAATDYDSGE